MESFFKCGDAPGSIGVANYKTGDQPEQIQATQASADFFHLLGASTILGRTYTGEEDPPGGRDVGAPQDGFSRTTRNPARCQLTTVSGFTISRCNVWSRWDSRSIRLSFGRGRLRLSPPHLLTQG